MLILRPFSQVWGGLFWHKIFIIEINSWHKGISFSNSAIPTFYASWKNHYRASMVSFQGFKTSVCVFHFKSRHQGLHPFNFMQRCMQLCFIFSKIPLDGLGQSRCPHLAQCYNKSARVQQTGVGSCLKSGHYGSQAGHLQLTPAYARQGQLGPSLFGESSASLPPWYTSGTSVWC